MFNVEKTLTLTRLNEIFEWPTLNQIYDPNGTYFSSYEEQVWWNTIAGYPNFTTRSSHASHIIHPVLRIFMRIMSYACFSKQDLGKLTKEEIKCLFLASRFEGNVEGNVNMGYLFIKRCIEIRESGEMSGEIRCGGMISIIARKLGFGSFLDQMTPVQSSNMLDLKALSDMKFLSEIPGRNLRFSWKVNGVHYCTLPNPAVNNSVGDTWQVPRDQLPRGMAGGGENVPVPRRMSTSSIPQSRVDGSSSSSSLFDVEIAFNQLNLTNQRLLEQNEYQSFVAERSYQHQVERGDFLPYLNYPNRPVQEGPVAGWNNGQPTYPFWQGPRSSIEELRSFPPYDYTQPGGSDYRGDPSYYYVPEVSGDSSSSEVLDPPLRGHYGFPPGYDGGWGEQGMPDFGHYRTCPNYDLPPYVDAPATSSDVDINYNYHYSPGRRHS